MFFNSSRKSFLIGAFLVFFLDNSDSHYARFYRKQTFASKSIRQDNLYFIRIFVSRNLYFFSNKNILVHYIKNATTSPCHHHVIFRKFFMVLSYTSIDFKRSIVMMLYLDIEKLKKLIS